MHILKGNASYECHIKHFKYSPTFFLYYFEFCKLRDEMQIKIQVPNMEVNSKDSGCFYNGTPKNIQTKSDCKNAQES